MSSASSRSSALNRPLAGTDIIAFQGRHGLDRAEVAYYLNLPAAQFSKKCSAPMLDYALELLMRLFDEDPGPPPWTSSRMTLPELFEIMYGKTVRDFKGTPYELEARVDLQYRFAKLLGRSRGRAYRWLDTSEQVKNPGGRQQKSHADIVGILGKLTQRKDPGGVLERLAKQVWMLRGLDIDKLHPIPTLTNPPKRGVRGPKPSKYRDTTKDAEPERKTKIEVTLRKAATPARKSPTTKKPDKT